MRHFNVKVKVDS